MKSELQASVVYRTGRPSFDDYEEAINELREAQSQLEPNGNNCHVCHDGGHQAWECHQTRFRESGKFRRRKEKKKCSQ